MNNLSNVNTRRDETYSLAPDLPLMSFPVIQCLSSRVLVKYALHPDKRWHVFYNWVNKIYGILRGAKMEVYLTILFHVRKMIQGKEIQVCFPSAQYPFCLCYSGRFY